MTVDTADALSVYLAESLHTGPPPARAIVSQAGHAFWACLDRPTFVGDRNLPLVSQPRLQREVLFELWKLGLAEPDGIFWRQTRKDK